MKSMFVKAVVLATSLVSLGAFAGEVDSRANQEQARINQGIQTGALTPREANRLEHRELRTEREIARDRALHGGHLTRREKARIQREENRTSRAIYRQKHDGQRD